MLLHIDCVLSRKREATGVAGALGVHRPHGVAAEQSKKRGEEVRWRVGKRV
jgi:hypothetical protein